MSVTDHSLDERWATAPTSRAPSRILVAITAVVAFFGLFRIGIPAAGSSLDGSWTTVLGWAFTHQMQFGEDIVFTYGPLGFLIPIANYYPPVFWLFLAGQVFLATVWALLVCSHSARVPPVQQAVLLALLLAWTPMLIVDVAWYLMFALAALKVHDAAVARNHGPAALLGGVVVCAALTVLALTKFTLLLVWFAFTGLTALQFWIGGQRRIAVASVLVATGFFVGLWLLAGQSPTLLPAFFSSSLEVSAGYGPAMGYTPIPIVDLAGLGALAASIACLVPLLFYRQRRWHAALTGLFLLLLLVLTWKAGYTRADSHVCIFLGMASLLVFCAFRLQPRPRRLAWFQPLVIAHIALGGIAVMVQILGGASSTYRRTWEFMAISARALTSPGATRDYLHGSWTSAAVQHSLPAFRRIVGDARVDVLMHEQGVALVNAMNYAPRPAFQGYLAYTPWLARLNEAELLGASAPDFLLFKLQAIDQRMPGSEDPLSQLAALRAYTPVAYEKGFVLMRRERKAAPIAPPQPRQWSEVALGDAIPLDAAPGSLLFYRAELSAVGSLYSLVFREPALGIVFTNEAGVERKYRLPRRLGEAGVLVSPLLADNADYLNWYAHKQAFAPRNLRIEVMDPAYSSLFAPRVMVARMPVELPRAPPSGLPEALRPAFYPGFSHMPSAEHSPAAIEIVRNLGTDMVFMHAPSWMEFTLPAGRWRADGAFGLRADVYAPGVCPASDGMQFRIIKANGSADDVLFQRQIDPLRVAADRGGLPFAIAGLTSDGQQPIRLEFRGGAADTANSGCDWAVLGPVRFTPLDSGAR